MSRDARFVNATMPALDLVYNLARRLTSRPEDAEDLVQETYLRAWQAWCEHREPRQVEPWLATICLNLARDAARRRQRRPRDVPDDLLAERASAQDVAEEALAHVLRGDIEMALGELAQEQRVAIVLVDLCGLSATEAAAVLDCPRGTVLSRVHRGRKALARRIGGREGLPV